MPVFDTAAAVRQSIGRNTYLEGKALRADTALREKQTEAIQYEIDAAPAKAAAAARKEERDISKETRLQEKADREAVKFWNDENKELLTKIGEAGAAFTLAREDGVDAETATAAYKTDVFGMLGEGAQSWWDKKIDRNGDGIISPEEEKLIAANARAIGKLAEKDAPSDYTLAPGSARFNEYDDRVAFNPKTPDTTIDLRDLGYLAENFEKKSIQKFVDSDYTDPTLLDPLLDPKDAKDAEEINTRIDASTAIIDEAVTLADNWTTGFPGYIKRVMETGEAYLDPNAEQPAKDFAEKLMFLQATNWREIVGSGQLSGADYTFLDGLFKGKGFGDDPVATKRSLNLLKDWLIGKKAVSGTVSTGQKYKEGDVADGPDGPLIYQNEEWVPYAE